jgi:hypothetical protein
MSIARYTSALVLISPVYRILIIKILACLCRQISTAEHVYALGFMHVVFATLRTQLLWDSLHNESCIHALKLPVCLKFHADLLYTFVVHCL